MSKKPASLTSDLLARKGEAEPSPIDPAARMSLFAGPDFAPADEGGGAGMAEERPRPPEPEIIYTADETPRGGGGLKLVGGIVLGAIAIGALLLVLSNDGDRGVAPVAPEIAGTTPTTEAPAAQAPAAEAVAPTVEAPSVATENPAAIGKAAPNEPPAAPTAAANEADVPTADAATQPAPTLRPGSETIPDAVETKPATAEPPKAVADTAVKVASKGAYVVQISALRDEKSAKAAWRLLEKRFPAVLGGHALDIEKADLGAKGTWFRVRAAGFETRTKAAGACAKLKAGGQDCMVKKR